MACDFDSAVVLKKIELFFTGDFANDIEHFADIPSGLDKVLYMPFLFLIRKIISRSDTVN